MNLGATRLRGKPRNRWQDEGRENGRLVSGKVGQERLYNREEWNKLLRTARNHRILHMPMNESGDLCRVYNDITKLLNATVRIIMPIPLSVCPYTMNNLSRKFCGIFENHLVINISLHSDNNSQCFTPDRFTFAVSTG